MLDVSLLTSPSNRSASRGDALSVLSARWGSRVPGEAKGLPRTGAHPHPSVTMLGPGSSFRHRGTRVRPVPSAGLRPSAAMALRGKRRTQVPPGPPLAGWGGEFCSSALLHRTRPAAPAAGPSEAKCTKPLARAQLTRVVSETEGRPGLRKARDLVAL